MGVRRALAVNAAKGQHRSQRLFTELLSETERSCAELQARFLEAALDYKIAWDRELARRDPLGLRDLAPPLPHPDHVVIDLRRGAVQIIGPATKEQKAAWDANLPERGMLKESVAQLRAANETDPGEIEDNLRFIEMGEKKLAAIRKVVTG